MNERWHFALQWNVVYQLVGIDKPANITETLLTCNNLNYSVNNYKNARNILPAGTAYYNGNQVLLGKLSYIKEATLTFWSFPDCRG